MQKLLDAVKLRRGRIEEPNTSPRSGQLRLVPILSDTSYARAELRMISHQGITRALMPIVRRL